VQLHLALAKLHIADTSLAKWQTSFWNLYAKDTTFRQIFARFLPRLLIFGIAVAYLVGLLVAAARCGCRDFSDCQCSALNILLVGILGTVLFSLVLLAVGIIATSVINAIIVGLAVGFFALIPTATARLIRNRFDCG